MGRTFLKGHIPELFQFALLRRPLHHSQANCSETREGVFLLRDYAGAPDPRPPGCPSAPRVPCLFSQALAGPGPGRTPFPCPLPPLPTSSPCSLPPSSLPLPAPSLSRLIALGPVHPLLPSHALLPMAPQSLSRALPRPQPRQTSSSWYLTCKAGSCSRPLSVRGAGAQRARVIA